MESKLIIKNSSGEVVELDACVIITADRYSELLKKEIGFEYRKAELKECGWVSTADKTMFGLKEREE